MDEGGFALIEMSLVFGGLLAFLIWELVSVRRARRDDSVNRREEQSDPERGA